MKKRSKRRSRNHLSVGKLLTNPVATLLARLFQNQRLEKHTEDMSKRPSTDMTLHNAKGRKYLNPTERKRFQKALEPVDLDIRLFCLTLMWSGCRISECLAVTAEDIDVDRAVLALRTLKRRRGHIIREVPLPRDLIDQLAKRFELVAAHRSPMLVKQRLWPWSRSTAWRYVKTVMLAADVYGGSAMPKGLRHTFGVAAFNSVPPHLVQRWLGHASLRTTAIYGNVSGTEEREMAERIWKEW